ncbi:RNA 2',3'-cyclic phosphodiesterase [Acidobacteria bacterium AH-259-D05]|nr:RNA 2',3'-cyclic phosphodiesterase [Acidobacteria bacterium AH-259-D05]
MIRAFIAVTVPESILGRCQEISDRLRELNLNGRFVKTQSMHLTLKFLGNIEEEKLLPIKEVLQETAREVAPFSLEIRQLGVFPHLGNPRVVWIGVQPIDALNQLQGKIQERLKLLGFPGENREFHSHLTLLRLKSRRNLSSLIQYVQGEGAGEEAGPLRVEEVHLYQSILKPDGAEYRKLVTVRLGGRADP